MDTSFCIEVAAKAIAKHGYSEIFNTDQGSQLISDDSNQVLKDIDARIGMDGNGPGSTTYSLNACGEAPSTKRFS